MSFNFNNELELKDHVSLRYVILIYCLLFVFQIFFTIVTPYFLQNISNDSDLYFVTKSLTILSIFLILVYSKIFVLRKAQISYLILFWIILLGFFYSTADYIVGDFFYEPLSKLNYGLVVNYKLYHIPLILIFSTFEEVIFRGLILKKMLKIVGMNWALVISSILFAMIHGSLGYFAFHFIFGLFAGVVYIKTRSLVYPIIFHIVTNLNIIFILKEVLP